MTKETKQILLIFILSLFLSYFTAKFIGNYIYSLLKPVSGFGPQLVCPACLDGFILSYLFFASLFFSFIKLKNKLWLLFLLPIIIFVNPPFEFLIIAVGIIIAGWLLAQGGLMVYKKLK